MIRKIFAFVFLIVLFSSVFFAYLLLKSDYYFEASLYKTAKELDLRKNKTHFSEILFVLHRGELISVIKKDGKWSRIHLENGINGYVESQNIRRIDVKLDVIIGSIFLFSFYFFFFVFPHILPEKNNNFWYDTNTTGVYF